LVKEFISTQNWRNREPERSLHLNVAFLELEVRGMFFLPNCVQAEG
jgi:hypothetical protein